MAELLDANGVPLHPCCDSVVALAPRTRPGCAIFAKNSDRPAFECQPLLQVAAAEHRPGQALACQYIEIEQVPHTYAFVGSRPYWLWGCEHGVNEHGVAIGNHTIYTNDAVADRGLIGMDLVRLGLERAANARQAVEVISTLIERYSQGGSGYADTDWSYHNSFMVADESEAYLLEASASNWALRKVADQASASNHVTIGTNWDELSVGCIEHAVEQGWCDRSGERFDFAAAYRDENTIPGILSSGRYAVTCSALSVRSADLDVAAFKRMMRDHYDTGEVFVASAPPDDERYFSVCMHAEGIGMTNASLIVELDAARGRPRLAWIAFSSPCIGPYLPLFLDAEIPAAWSEGDREQSSGGAWWRLRGLLSAVEKDHAAAGPMVRECWRDYEQELEERTTAVIDAVLDAGAETRNEQLASFMDEVWRETEARIAKLLARL